MSKGKKSGMSAKDFVGKRVIVSWLADDKGNIPQFPDRIVAQLEPEKIQRMSPWPVDESVRGYYILPRRGPGDSFIQIQRDDGQYTRIPIHFQPGELYRVQITAAETIAKFPN